MGKENSVNPNYSILAYVTLNRERVVGGNPLVLVGKDEEEQKGMAIDIAKGLKADVVQLHCGDYMVIRV